MKILYVTTIGLTMTFFKQLVRELIEEGNTVDIMCNEEEKKVPDCYREWNCNIYHHTCSRSPLSLGNIQAIRQIRRLVKEKRYDIVHCHTPIASICTRMACRNLRKENRKVIYTAHGFHFYKGAPLKNWLIYYPIEKICSRWTDVLITINQEDYELARRKMKAKKVEFVPGVGIDVKKFENTYVDRTLKRKELGVPENVCLIVSVGELNTNKNHEVIIQAMAKQKDEKIHYVIAGEGPLNHYLKGICEQLGISKQIHFLGYRYDVAEIYKVADICCFPSIREGLGLAAIEGMACSLPVIAAENRGTREFVRDGVNGFLINHKDSLGFAKAIDRLMRDKQYRRSMGEAGTKTARRYDISKVNSKMKQIYFGKETKEFLPKVSIIIPVYNGSNYMREAIDSALTQTYKNFEVIVINDGSTDGGETERIAKEYGERIHYIHKENGGVSIALNIGIRNMRGEYFSWLSHDDMYTPDKLEKSIQALAEMRNKKTIICCQSVHIDKESEVLPNQNLHMRKNENRLYTWDDALLNLEKQGTMNGCSLLIHKDILSECGLFDESLRFNQDGFMWNKMFLRRYPLLVIPHICVKNRIHEKQLTQTGQDIFHRDCEKMSEFLIPELIEVSNKEKNIIVEYIKYNAKYNNQNVVRNAYQKAMEKDLIGSKNKLEIKVWSNYGKIRPIIRRIYYKLFRKM